MSYLPVYNKVKVFKFRLLLDLPPPYSNELILLKTPFGYYELRALQEACFRADFSENIGVTHDKAETIPPVKSTGKRNRKVKEGE